MESQEALDLLASIDTTLKAMLALAQQRTAQARASQPKAIATDRDLDGKYGNPEVKFNPRDWNGPSFKNARMSECPAAFLDLLAETFDYFAQKAEEKDERTDSGKSVAVFKRADAARARGWAKRNRNATPTAPATTGTATAPAGDDWGVGDPWFETDEERA